MKRFKEMNFYSTAEIAEKLGMNIQVVARKLQAGEIEGYKVGKDWRVEETAIQKWLVKISNQQQLSPKDKVLSHFIKDGRLKQLPAQQKKRFIVLEFFLNQFQPNQTYSEQEVNEIISRYYDDYCTIRREMIDWKMMFRKDDTYKRNSSYRMKP